MHHYQFNIGDYRKDTGHLTLLEHGIYRMLIDSYYANEGPLEADDKTLMRTHCIRSADEEEAYKNVVNDFFELDEGHYHHEGCDKVLAKIFAKSESARKSAEARWARKNKGSKRTQCERNANGMREGCESDATHNPEPNNPTHSSTKAERCPTQKIIDLYNETTTRLPQVRVASDAMKVNIGARWKQDDKFKSLDFWKELFEYCDQNNFLSGQTSGSRDSPFRASLEWIVKPTNFAKIINLNYDNS